MLKEGSKSGTWGPFSFHAGRTDVAGHHSQTVRTTTARPQAFGARAPAIATDTRRSIAAAAVFVAYAALWSASSALLHGRSDLDLFFWPAAQTVISGHPLAIYASNNVGAGPYANGPLGLLPLIPIAAIADAGGWAANIDGRAVASNAVFTLGSLLMTLAAMRLIRAGRGSIEWRLAAFCTFLLAPTLWVSLASFGHFEQPIELWLILIAVGLVLRGRLIVAGCAIGMALLTRTTALLYLISLVAVGLSVRKLKDTMRVAGTAVMVALLGLSPFIIMGAPNLIHALVGYRGDEPIGGGSLWSFALGSSWSLTIQHIDTYLALALAAGLCALIVRRNPASAASPAGLCGLLAIAASLFPMFAKTAYPYYFLEPYVFVTIWWLARPGRAFNRGALAPLLVTCAMLLAQQSATRLLTGIGVAEGVCASVALMATVLLVVHDLLSTRATLGQTSGADISSRRHALIAAKDSG